MTGKEAAKKPASISSSLTTIRDRLAEERIRKLRIALFLTSGYVAAQIIVGIFSHSLALVADAGHVLTDVGGLALSLIAIRYTRKPTSPQRTYGFYRMEILASLVNSLALMLLSTYIFYEAYRRIIGTPEVHSLPVVIVAGIGLVVNYISLRILGGHLGHPHDSAEDSEGSNQRHNNHYHHNVKVEDDEDDYQSHDLHDNEEEVNNKDKIREAKEKIVKEEEHLNVATARFEVLSDTIGSAVVIAAGVVMLTTRFYLADPIASIGLAIFILPRTWTFIKKSMHILMEAVPANISYEEIKNALLSIRGVTGVFDLHIWTITSGMNSMSAHVVVIDMNRSQAILHEISSLLERQFKITHATIQIESYHSETESF